MGGIFVIRHGETAWNREEIYRGRLDVALSERGRQQARLLADALRDEPIRAVFSSPLSRTRETAKPLAEALGLGVSIDERLIDMSFGEWEGRPRAEVARAEPDLHHTWLTQPARFRAPGGESLSDVLARAWPALQEIAERHAEGGAAVVSHRVVCKLLLCAGLGVGEAGFWRVRVDTASVSLLEASGGLWAVARVNETHHLAALGEGDRSDF